MEGTSGNQAAGRANGKETIRQADRAYRAHQKESNEKMKAELGTLEHQCEELRQENESLFMRKNALIQQSALVDNEINQLRKVARELNGEMDCNEIVINAVLEKLDKVSAGSLANERDPLSQDVMLDEKMQAKKDLLDKKTKLEHTNKLLKLERKAMCEQLRNKDSKGSNSSG